MKNNFNKKPEQSFGLKVVVENGNINKALKQFKRKVKDSGLLQELRSREYYEKPSEAKQRKRKASIRRHKKAQLNDNR